MDGAYLLRTAQTDRLRDNSTISVYGPGRARTGPNSRYGERNVLTCTRVPIPGRAHLHRTNPTPDHLNPLRARQGAGAFASRPSRARCPGQVLVLRNSYTASIDPDHSQLKCPPAAPTDDPKSDIRNLTSPTRPLVL